MPGGGLEPNESFQEAAIREAHEETGCTFSLGSYVWFRRHKHIWNRKPFDQYERFFVARVPEPTYDPSQQDSYISKHRWFSMDELQRSTDDFAPSNIRSFIVPILQGQNPSEAFDCGV